ncbi:MAG: serine hydrolase domain-containing protein [Saprospiraceae bacterium]
MLWGFLCILFLPAPVHAQQELIPNLWKEALRETYLLRNEGGLVPVKHLESTRIRFRTIGMREGIVRDYLARYTLIEEAPANQIYPAVASSKKFENLWSQTIEIVSLNLNLISPEILAEIRSIALKGPTLVLAFGPAAAWNGVDWPEAVSGVIWSVGDLPEQQAAAAQLVFGGISVDNRLTMDINRMFPAGSGLSSGPAIRLGYAPPAFVEMNRTMLLDSIQHIADQSIAAQAFPGMQVLVAKDGYVVYHQAFGNHEYNSDHPLQKSDIFDFASVTKVTAGLPCLMQFHDQGRLPLDAPLKDFWPELKHSNKSDIPLREVLAHNARLIPYITYWQTAKKKNGKWKWHTFKQDSSSRYNIWITDSLWLYRNYQKKIVKAIKKSSFNPEPGYVYSGLLFLMIPELVQRLTGMPFDEYVRQSFYRPLGAYTLTHKPYEYFPLDRIVPTEDDTFFRMEQVHGSVHDENAAMMGGVSSNAGLFGNANDLAKLAEMYLQFGTYGNQRFISDTTFREFTRCQYCEEGNRRGLGFDKPLIEYNPKTSSVCAEVSPESFGHSGYTGTFVWMDPKYRLVYIFFSNRVYPSREHTQIYSLNVRPRIQHAIYQSFLK